MATGRKMGFRHQDDVKAKIQTSLLLGRLQDSALGKLELTAIQVKSIEILLNKTLSDAPKQVEVDAEVREYVVSGEPQNADEWQTSHSLGTTIGASESLN